MSSKSSKSKSQRAAIRKAGRELFKQGVQELSQNPNNLGLAATAISKGQNWKNALKQAGATVAAGALGATSAGKSGATKAALTAAAVQQAQNIVRNVKGTNHVVKGAIAALLNDLKWYGHYPELLSEMIGPNFNLPLGDYDIIQSLISTSSLPLVVAIDVNLTQGDDTNDAVKSAMNRIFTSIRQANAGSVNYNRAQVAGFIFNVRQLIALYSIGNRILRELNNASLINRAVPFVNFTAMGIDYDTFADNAANLRNFLITLKVRLQSYAVMKMDIFERTEWLFRGTFWDSDDPKHQLFLFRCPFFHMYTESAGAAQSFKLFDDYSVSGTGMTYSNWITMAKNITNVFFSTPIYSTISGDIVKAFGVDELYHLPDVASVDEKPICGYSEEVLTQIQNAWLPHEGDCVLNGGTAQFTHSLIPSANDDCLVETIAIGSQTQNGYGGLFSNNLLSRTYINMYKKNISNLDVLGATRLACAAKFDTATKIKLTTYGTEIPIGYTSYTYATSSPAKYKVIAHAMGNFKVMTVGSPGLIVSVFTSWAATDYFPRVVGVLGYYASGSTTITYTPCAHMFDWNEYAVLSDENQFRYIHEAATQSLYYVPLLVKNSNNVVDYN